MNVIRRLLLACILILGSGLFVNAQLNSDDDKFLSNAAEGGQAEVEFAQLALKKSQNPGVREFANRIIKDHGKANQELKALASSKGIKWPKGIGAMNNAELLKLKALSGDTFDRSYVDSMVDDHKRDLGEFEKASQGAVDVDVKNFAGKMLPTLEEHYKLIQTLQKKLQPQ